MKLVDIFLIVYGTITPNIINYKKVIFFQGDDIIIRTRDGK